VRSRNNESGTVPDDAIWSSRSVDIGEIMTGMGKTQFFQFQLLHKGIHEPHRVIGGHLLFERTEISLRTVSSPDDYVSGQAFINCMPIL
jgi:hypothetical protein